MSINRRKFLKMAGISTLLGIGGVSAVQGVKNRVEASQVLRSPEALTAKRWAMVVDMSKFKSEESASAGAMGDKGTDQVVRKQQQRVIAQRQAERGGAICLCLPIIECCFFCHFVRPLPEDSAIYTI